MTLDLLGEQKVPAQQKTRKGPQILSSKTWSLLGYYLKVMGYLAVENWSQSQEKSSIKIRTQWAAGQTFTYRERTNNLNYMCKDLKHLQL